VGRRVLLFWGISLMIVALASLTIIFNIGDDYDDDGGDDDDGGNSFSTDNVLNFLKLFW